MDFSLAEMLGIVNLSLARSLSLWVFILFELGSYMVCCGFPSFLCDLSDVKPSREIAFRWEALICDQMDYYHITCFHALLSVPIHIP